MDTNKGVARPPRFFYGWVIVVVSWLANFTTVSMNPLIFAFFIDPMSHELGVSRATLVWGFTIRQVAGGLFAPVLGRIVDVHGSRWPGFVSGLIVAAVLVCFSFTPNIWVLYLLFAVSGLTGFATLGGNLLTIVPVANWFVVKRGRAVSIASTGAVVGTTLFVLLAQLLIHTVGWRWAWSVFAILVFVVVPPTYAIFMRRRPEDMGLLPDGLSATAFSPATTSMATTQPSPAEETNWTLAQAIRNSTFWFILIALTISSFASGPVLLYRALFWSDRGISPAVVALGIAVDPLTVVFAQLLFGLLAERYAVRYMAVVGGLWRGACMVPLLAASQISLYVFVHNLLWGIGSGGLSVVQNLIFPNYFGRRHQGAIRGFSAPLMVAGSALGAPLAGYLLDSGGGFSLLWQLCLWGMMVPNLAFYLFRPPKLSQRNPITKGADQR